MAKEFLDHAGLSYVFTKIKAMISKAMGTQGVTTAGDGAAYTATVDGISALTAGVTFIMIPHTVSTSATATLNVNNLGAKMIRRRVSNSTVTTVASATAGWLGKGKPVRVTYDGTYWIADLDRPNATDIYGTVAIANGGTGATTAAQALANLGAMSIELLWENASPSSSFASQEVTTSKKITDYQFIMVTTTDVLASSAIGPTAVGSAIRQIAMSNHIAFRSITIIDEYTINFSEGNNSTPLHAGNVTFSADNSRIVPWKIYGIKGVY